MPTDSIVFVDTNVLLYAASRRAADSVMALQARDLIRRERIAISFQVLQEFYTNAVNPKKLALSNDDALAYCREWLALPVVTLDAPLFVRTLEFVARYMISNWDGAILAAAEKAGCKIVFSEDLNDKQKYFGIQVRNPFR